MASSKRSSGGFFTKKSGKNAISHDCAKWKIDQHHFHLPGAFRMTVRNFSMVMRNQFSLFPFSYSQNPFCSISHDYANFSHVHAKWKNIVFSTPFCHFFHFFLLIPLQLPPNQLQTLIKTNCITSFIMYLDTICSLQFYSSLLSQIYHNYTLKWLQNFIKLISNSCKGNNILIECFKHNY